MSDAREASARTPYGEDPPRGRRSEQSSASDDGVVGAEDVWADEDGETVVRLRRWKDPWPEGDPHANFKAEVQLYGKLDPLVTIRGMSRNLDIPVGAIARFVLARWATGGSGGLLELGPVMVPRMWEPIAKAEEADSDEERLAAYHQLRQMISWLKVPLDDPSVYP